jgi:ATP phosphoribosyltransferase regulatory subunit
MRDQTSEDVAARRRLEARILDVFARWGYTEVATPTLEYLETFLRAAGPTFGDRLMKLVDGGGEVLALRPEMTVPIARLAATRLLPAGVTPLRVSYVATVFRSQDAGSGRLREFIQAGVELIGDGSVQADTEVIALAAEALQTARPQSPAISVSHAGFLRGVLSMLPEDDADTVRDLLYRRAFADLDRVVPPGPALDALRMVPALRGADALARAAPLAASAESRAALDLLRGLLEGVAAYDPAVRIDVDLGLIRDFDYYSGIVFEAHAGGVGQPLLGGGRYDGLLARFGHAAPATGFALSVERLLEAGTARDAERAAIVVRYDPGAYRRAVRAAASLRAAGLGVVVVPAGIRDGIAGAACTVTVTDGALRVAGASELSDRARAVLEAAAWTP